MPVTILQGRKESGVTLHKMEQTFDTGDILLQQAFSVGPEDNLETVTEQVRTVAADLCRQMAVNFDQIWAKGRPQGVGEYWPCPQKSDYTITEETTPQKTERILRAFFGYDCYLKTRETEYRIVRGVFRACAWNRPFGTVETRSDGSRIYVVQGGVIETAADKECADNGA